MIYLDTSVALAPPLAVDRRPPAEMWEETLVALATYDGRMREAGVAMGFELYGRRVPARFS